MGEMSVHTSSSYLQMRHEVAKFILDQGGRIVPIRPGSKAPRIASWTKGAATKISTVDKYSDDTGIAVVFDSALIDVETDNDIALKARKYANLPPTNFCWGRRSSPGSHLLYKAAGELRPFQVKSSIKENRDNRQNLIELRYGGSHYSILPPSIHPSGEEYQFVSFGEILPIPDDFYARLEYWGALSLLAENWTLIEGSRSDISGALAAFLRQQKWETNNILSFITAITEITEDDEARNRLDYAQRSIEKVDQGEPTTGSTLLQECLTSEVWDEIQLLLGITRLNRSARFDLSEVGFAVRIIEQHREDIRYCTDMNYWYVWDGTRWKYDNEYRLSEIAVDVRNSILEEAKTVQDGKITDALYTFYKRAGKRTFLHDSILLAGQHTPEIKRLYESFDMDPWLFNCGNGTLNLRTGQLHTPDPGDYLTKKTDVNYEPNANGPVSCQFMNQVFHNDVELIDYVFRLFGIAMIGEQIEHILPVFWGIGGNGKSTLLEVVREVFGEYGQKAAVDLFLSKREGGPQPEVISLKGVRFTYSSEGLDTGQSFADGKIKTLTGGDMITARDLHKSEIEFKPSHTIFLATNALPDIRNIDDGIKRRLKFIPFTASFKYHPLLSNEYLSDPIIKDRLLSEKEWWLARIFQGCQDYLKDGLQDPISIQGSTQEFFEEIDPLAEWLGIGCVLNPADTRMEVSNIDLYADYKEYCSAKREKPLIQRKFSALLKARQLTNSRGMNGYTFWQGISLVEGRADYAVIFKTPLFNFG